MKKLLIAGLASLIFLAVATLPRAYSVQTLYTENERFSVKIITVIIGDGQYKMFHGTGFFISENGDVATAAHVIYDDELGTYARFIILTNDKKEYYRAEVKKIDLRHDIAILKICEEVKMSKLTPKNISIQSAQPTSHKFKYAVLGDTEHLRVGDKVYSIGYPTVYFNMLTEGIIITSKPQLVPNKDTRANYEDVMATSMYTQHGNSGSSVMDRRGRVIGVLTMGLETSPFTLFQRVEYLKKLMADTSNKIIIQEKEAYDDEPSLF